MQHTLAGGIIVVEVEIQASEEPQRMVQISVEDTGEGIPPEELPCIWERFYHGKDAHPYEGTGLGLALVKELTEAMQGSIKVESVLGEGSRFTIRLPRV